MSILGKFLVLLWFGLISASSDEIPALPLRVLPHDDPEVQAFYNMAPPYTAEQQNLKVFIRCQYLAQHGSGYYSVGPWPLAIYADIYSERFYSLVGSFAVAKADPKVDDFRGVFSLNIPVPCPNHVRAYFQMGLFYGSIGKVVRQRVLGVYVDKEEEEGYIVRIEFLGRPEEDCIFELIKMFWPYPAEMTATQLEGATVLSQKMVPYLPRMLTTQYIHTWSLFCGQHKVVTFPSLPQLAEFYRTFQAKGTLFHLSGWRDSQFSAANTHRATVTLKGIPAAEAMDHFEILLGTILVRSYVAYFNGLTQYGLFNLVGFAYDSASACGALHLYYDGASATRDIELDLRHVYYPAVVIGTTDTFLDATVLNVRSVDFGEGTPQQQLNPVQLHQLMNKVTVAALEKGPFVIDFEPDPSGTKSMLVELPVDDLSDGFLSNLVHHLMFMAKKCLTLREDTQVFQRITLERARRKSSKVSILVIGVPERIEPLALTMRALLYMLLAAHNRPTMKLIRILELTGDKWTPLRTGGQDMTRMVSHPPVLIQVKPFERPVEPVVAVKAVPAPKKPQVASRSPSRQQPKKRRSPPRPIADPKPAAPQATPSVAPPTLPALIETPALGDRRACPSFFSDHGEWVFGFVGFDNVAVNSKGRSAYVPYLQRYLDAFFGALPLGYLEDGKAVTVQTAGCPSNLDLLLEVPCTSPMQQLLAMLDRIIKRRLKVCRLVISSQTLQVFVFAKVSYVEKENIRFYLKPKETHIEPKRTCRDDLSEPQNLPPKTSAHALIFTVQTPLLLADQQWKVAYHGKASWDWALLRIRLDVPKDYPRRYIDALLEALPSGYLDDSQSFLRFTRAGESSNEERRFFRHKPGKTYRGDVISCLASALQFISDHDLPIAQVTVDNVTLSINSVITFSWSPEAKAFHATQLNSHLAGRC